MCCAAVPALNPALFDELALYIDSLHLGDDAEANQSYLIDVLHRAQHIFGYLPPEVQEFVAARMHLPLQHVFGVITFYHYFSTQPRGKHQINFCLGTACYVRGIEQVIARFESKLGIKMGQTTADNKFTLGSLRCVGACSLAPVVMIGDKVYGKVTPEQVEGILEEYQAPASA
jgi:NADH-quinone oxidoreductase subunit E